MDEAQTFWQREYFNETYVHPVGLAMLLLMIAATFILPRRWAILPTLILACFVASAQRIAFITLDFNFLRCMVIAAVLRMVFRNELRGLKWTGMDTGMVAWAISAVFIFVIQRADPAALMNRLGYTFEALGLYFMFRGLIRDWDDVVNVTMQFAVIAVPVLGFFLYERATRYNLFSIFGGVPAITVERQGRLRCQGAFSHPILAGCFWASVLPLMAAMFWQSGVRRLLGVIGFVASCAIILLCASSTPVAAALFAGLGFALFYIRKQMTYVRWGVVALLVALHLSMNKPVWHLIARTDFVGGSTSWYRFNLIDKAIRNWPQWIAIGKSNTADWGLSDITNEYVLTGLRGGGLTLACLLIVMFLGFRNVGRVSRAYEHHKPTNILAWSMGAMLFAHAMSFFSVSYFGQIVMLYHLTIAMIASIASQTESRLISARAARRKRALPRTPVGVRPGAQPGLGAS